jgi:hypothetical protein
MAKDRICNVDFMEEIQKYGCLHSKFFSKDYKNKEFKKMLGKSCRKIQYHQRRRFKISAGIRRFLKKSSMPSGLGRDAVPTRSEFANFDGLVVLLMLL